MKAIISELSCQYDSKQSFYGKAQIVREEEIGIETLCSYGVPVVQRSLDKPVDSVIFSKHWDESPTTLRHVKEYLKQICHPFRNMTKAELAQEFKKNKNLIGEF